MGRRLNARVELGEVALEMLPPALGLGDHLAEAVHLRLERTDLAVHPGERVVDDRAPLDGIARRPESVPIACPGGLVLEQLADLGEAEASIVAEALDESKPVKVVFVVEA